jgi:hypothetical protein
MKASGGWNSLQNIPTSKEIDPAGYAGTALQYCNTLETLFLHFYSLKNAIPFTTSMFNNLVKNLNKFTNLEKLEIEYEEDSEEDRFAVQDGTRDMIELDESIENCSPALNSITLNVNTEAIGLYDSLPIVLYNSRDISLVKHDPIYITLVEKTFTSQ